MGYEYFLLAAAIIVPLGIFSVFKGDLTGAAQVSNEKRSSLPGAFGNDSTSTKSKKKKNKKKNKSSTTATGAATRAAAGDDNDDESSDSEVEEKRPMTRQNKKSNNSTTSNSTPAQVAPSAKKANNNHSSKGSNATVPSPSSTSIPSANNNNNKSTSGNDQESVKAKARNNNTTSTKQTPAVSTPTVTAPSPAAAGNKATSVEDWKKQRQAEQKEILTKQQETLQFSSAASKYNSSFSSSPNVTSIPGPGAMGNNKKKNRGQAGAGLSHAEFPSLSRPQPAPAPAPKQPKQKKEKKDKEAVKPEPIPEPVPEPVPVQESEEESDGDNDKEQQLRDDQLMAQQLAWSEGEGEQEEEEEEEDEWTTVSGNGAAPVRSGGIDFSKPMDPWVAQRQRQLQDEIAAADPHGEQTTQFARVLSIKPAAKEERFREAIPDGFSVQKTRSGTSTGSSSYQTAEITKKQRENLAKAAKRKEDKAAADALQEKRKQEHMRQVKAEKMKEFYRSQSRKSAPVESRWDVPKSSNVSSSTVSGGMSAQVNDKGRLIWD